MESMFAGFWKIAALSTVIGTCSLVVVNVYGQLNQLNQLKQPLVQAPEENAPLDLASFDNGASEELPTQAELAPTRTSFSQTSGKGVDFRLVALADSPSLDEASPADDVSGEQQPIVRSQSGGEANFGPSLALPAPVDGVAGPSAGWDAPLEPSKPRGTNPQNASRGNSDSGDSLPTPPALPDLNAPPLTSAPSRNDGVQALQSAANEAVAVQPGLLPAPDAKALFRSGNKQSKGAIQQTSGIQADNDDPFANAFPADLPPAGNSSATPAGDRTEGMQPYRRPTAPSPAPASPSPTPAASDDPFGLELPVDRPRLPQPTNDGQRLPRDRTPLPASIDNQEEPYRSTGSRSPGESRNAPLPRSSTPIADPAELEVQLGSPSPLNSGRAPDSAVPRSGSVRSYPSTVSPNLPVEPAFGPGRDFPGRDVIGQELPGRDYPGGEIPRREMPPRADSIQPTNGLDRRDRNDPLLDDPFGEKPAGSLPALRDRDSLPVREQPSRSTPPAQDDPFGESPTSSVRPNVSVPAAAADVPARAVEQPRVTIEKQAPASAVLGQSLIYTVVVKNEGTVSARQVVVEDRIPKGTQLTGTAPRAEINEKRLIWKLGTLAPGEARTIQIRVTPVEEGPIGSVARVSFVAEVAAEIVVAAAELDVRGEVPSEATLGKPFTMVFRVRNVGQNLAKEVVVRDLLPESIQHPAGRDVEYLVGDLQPGESHDVTLEVVPMNVGRVTNAVTVLAQGMRPIELKKEISILGSGLAVTQQVPTRAIVGRPARFDNVVQNQGAASLRGVRVSEIVPAGFEFAEATEGGAYDPSTRTVNWEINELLPGSSRTVSARLTPRQVGDAPGSVMVSSADGAKASVETVARAEGLPSITIVPMDDQKLIAVGERVLSRLVVKNRGSAPATGVALAIDIPPGLKLINIDGPVRHTQQGTRVIFQMPGTVAAGAELAFEMELEASREGDNPIGVQVVAEHMLRPLHRDDVIQVVSDSATTQPGTSLRR
jgi:uncharacterized repeat protein (TIGR01451 family)